MQRVEDDATRAAKENRRRTPATPINWVTKEWSALKMPDRERAPDTAREVDRDGADRVVEPARGR